MPCWRPGAGAIGSAIIHRVETLRLAIQHKTPEPRDEELPTGQVRVEDGQHRALLLTPDRIDLEQRYPLVTVLHGAGRREILDQVRQVHGDGWL